MKFVVVWLKLLLILSHLLPQLYLHCAVQSQFVTACFLPHQSHVMAVCFSNHFNLKNYARDGFLSSGLWQHASWNICVTTGMLGRLCEAVTRQSAAVGGHQWRWSRRGHQWRRLLQRCLEWQLQHSNNNNIYWADLVYSELRSWAWLSSQDR